MSGYFKKVAAQTETRFWINNVTRKEADMALEEGAMGCTQNPSYTYKMLVNPEEGEYAKAMLEAIVAEEADDTEALVKLQRALVGEVAKKFMPLYEASTQHAPFTPCTAHVFYAWVCLQLCGGKSCRYRAGCFYTP